MNKSAYSVLVVDDEPAICGATVRALSDEGIECTQAANGAEAMQHLANQHFDLVITDLRMPVMHGHSLVTELLQREKRPLVIVLTGLLEPKLAQDLTNRGIDDIFFKPVDYTLLAARLKELLLRTDPTINPDSITDSTNSKVLADSQDSDESRPVELESPRPDSISKVIEQPVQVVGILLNSKDRTEDLAQRLSSESVTTITLSSPEELTQALKTQDIDLIVVENELAGSERGMDILHHLHQQISYLETILLTHNVSVVKDQANSLGIEIILEAYRSLDEIGAVVQNTLSVKETLGLRHSDLFSHQVLTLVQQNTYIQPIPELVIKLLPYMVMKPDDISIEAVAKNISLDPQITADLLKMVNSPTMGLRTKTTTPLDVVKLIGPKKTITLIVTSSIFKALSGLHNPSSDTYRTLYYQRSIMIASVASIFAHRLEGICADTAFMLGLLQDIGILFLEKHFQRPYQMVIQRVRENGRLQLHVLENLEFEMTHAELSAALLDSWGFPWSLVEPILNHNPISDITAHQKIKTKYSRVMQIGEALADLEGDGHPVRIQELQQLLDEYGSENWNLCKSCISKSVTKTIESSQLFSLPKPDPSMLANITHLLTSLDNSSVLKKDRQQATILTEEKAVRH